ncbi:hypothetical protein CSKR_102410 [Clonorchis sinensis]|uniref:Uncharacterized protein n=1 Tax=Clonorchis sinensis TaxID=79923 RepID=A0A419QF06_CLOSI|nr:hypothetical protein CSKR_102410 [Clonorchis sinensis]
MEALYIGSNTTCLTGEWHLRVTRNTRISGKTKQSRSWILVQNKWSAWTTKVQIKGANSLPLETVTRAQCRPQMAGCPQGQMSEVMRTNKRQFIYTH